MHTGHTISGTAHAALILWVLFGGVFRSEPDAVRVQDVSVLSEQEFAALSERAAPPESTQDVTAPPVPETEPAPAPEIQPPTPEPEAQTPPQPEPAPQPEPETVPEAVPMPPQADVQDEAPALDPPAPEPQVDAPQVSDRPTPRPAPRVAPEPVPEPERDVAVAPEPEPEVAPEPELEPEVVPEPPQETAQPEAAAPEIVTEAEEPARAPDASPRPRTRPSRPAPAATPAEPETETAEAAEPAPEETPAPEAAETSQEAPADPVADAVADAVAEALASGGTTSPDPDLPVGPPMTAGEKDALRVAVQRCWVVDVGSQAANVTVTVGMDMTQDGRVVANSIRLVSADGGSGGASETAFQAARRAILRCQGDGFPLPAEKYAQWQEIEMTFDPSGMRIR